MLNSTGLKELWKFIILYRKQRFSILFWSTVALILSAGKIFSARNFLLLEIFVDFFYALILLFVLRIWDDFFDLPHDIVFHPQRIMPIVWGRKKSKVLILVLTSMAVLCLFFLSAEFQFRSALLAFILIMILIYTMIYLFVARFKINEICILKQTKYPMIYILLNCNELFFDSKTLKMQMYLFMVAVGAIYFEFRSDFTSQNYRKLDKISKLAICSFASLGLIFLFDILRRML